MAEIAAPMPNTTSTRAEMVLVKITAMPPKITRAIKVGASTLLLSTPRQPSSPIGA